jgi:hypothetical protein
MSAFLDITISFLFNLLQLGKSIVDILISYDDHNHLAQLIISLAQSINAFTLDETIESDSHQTPLYFFCKLANHILASPNVGKSILSSVIVQIVSFHNESNLSVCVLTKSVLFL